MGGWAFSLDSLAPKLEKLSPIKGFGRMFGLQSLVELFKALLKFLLVAAVAFLIIYYSVQEIIALGVMNVVSAMAKAGSLLLWSFIGFSSVLILIAMIDVPFQLWQHKDKLKMTKQEIRDEMKDSEGRPEVKESDSTDATPALRTAHDGCCADGGCHHYQSNPLCGGIEIRGSR